MTRMAAGTFQSDVQPGGSMIPASRSTLRFCRLLLLASLLLCTRGALAADAAPPTPASSVAAATMGTPQQAGTAITARPDGRAVPVEGGDVLGTLAVYRPNGPIKAFVYLFSDDDGWTDDLNAVGRVLAEEGVLVAGVDLNHVLANSATPDQDCFYLVSDLEEMAQEVEKDAGIEDYMTPILVGRGHGGTLAYVALTQSPDVTTEGIITVDALPSLATKQPFCGPAPFHRSVAGGWAYGMPPGLPGWWRAAVHPGQNDYFPWLDRLDEAEKVTLDEQAGLGRALAHLVMETVAEVRSSESGGLADLPLVELPAAQDGPFLAVIISGDGGWRDLDKTIGEWLSAHGVATVGVDALRYFWTTKQPAAIARDVTRIVNRYLPLWHREKVLLVGYSFGAGILPATFDALSPEIQAKVAQVSLLGIAPKADFEFHVTGWLGSTSAEAQDVTVPFARIDKRLVQCFYGKEEEDSLCALPVAEGTERVLTEGGHHFDGDYPKLAETILKGAERRLGGNEGAAAKDADTNVRSD